MPATTLIAIMRGVKREEFFVPIMICTIFYDLLFGCARSYQLSIDIYITSIPARFSSSMPSSKRYFSDYTTRLIPAWMMSLAHSIQGEAVTYIVAPLLLLLERAILVMALASAWST